MIFGVLLRIFDSKTNLCGGLMEFSIGKSINDVLFRCLVDIFQGMVQASERVNFLPVDEVKIYGNVIGHCLIETKSNVSLVVLVQKNIQPKRKNKAFERWKLIS